MWPVVQSKCGQWAGNSRIGRKKKPAGSISDVCCWAAFLTYFVGQHFWRILLGSISYSYFVEQHFWRHQQTGSHYQTSDWFVGNLLGIPSVGARTGIRERDRFESPVALSVERKAVESVWSWRDHKAWGSFTDSEKYEADQALSDNRPPCQLSRRCSTWVRFQGQQCFDLDIWS